jgi:hypothetical protein
LLAAQRTNGKSNQPAASPDNRGWNGDPWRPLYFSQRLRALSAEWTPALYLAVPILNEVIPCRAEF